MQRRTVIDQLVDVAPTLTVVVPPFQASNSGALNIEVTNNDLTQTLAFAFDKAMSDAGPWGASDYAGLTSIPPGVTKNIVVDLQYLAWVRVRGTASGAGAQARVKAVQFSGAGFTW